MGLFNNRQQAQALSQRQQLEAKYEGARKTLYGVLGFTVINMILLLTNANSYFLFSAYAPYMITDYAMFYCGKYPVEFYQEYGTPIGGFQGSGVFAVMLVIAALIMVMYLLCGILSGKGRTGWMVFGLVLFVLDTVGYLLDWIGYFSSDNILDLVFHGLVIVSLIGGLSAGVKLKKLPPEEEPAENYMDAFLQPAEEPAATAPTEE